MKFIDLYNKAKKHPDFIERNRRFKNWVYLCKKNPDKYEIEWGKKGAVCCDYFRFSEWKEAWSVGGTYQANRWVELENSKGLFNSMIEYSKYSNV